VVPLPISFSMKPIHPEKTAADWAKFFLPAYFTIAFMGIATIYGVVAVADFVFYFCIGVVALATGLLIQEYNPHTFSYYGRTVYHSAASLLIVGAGVYVLPSSSLLLLISALFVLFLSGWTLEILNVETIFSIHHTRYHIPDFSKTTHYEAGTLWLLATLILLFFFSPPIAYASILVFALGDASAASIGKNFGRLKNPYNPKKTLEGSFAFFAVSLFAAMPFVPTHYAIIVAALAAFVESLPLRFNDNFTVPIATGLILQALTMAGV
jgi:dolichol kinase